MTVQSPACQRHVNCQFIRFLFGFQPGPHYTVMLQAYLDESGHPHDPNSDVFSVAAIVATEEGWHTFEDQWNAVLMSHNIRGLHMSEYQSRKGEFEHWGQKDREAAKFLDDLGSVFIDTIQYGCVVSVAMDDWNEVMRDRFETQYERKRASLIVLFNAVWKRSTEQACFQQTRKLLVCLKKTPLWGEAYLAISPTGKRHGDLKKDWRIRVWQKIRSPWVRGSGHARL